jgi:hypothetical protein
VLAAFGATGVLSMNLLSPGGAYGAALVKDASVSASSRVSGVILNTLNKGSQVLATNFAKIKADGANMVNITVWWQVPNASSDSVMPEYGTETITDPELQTIAGEAAQAGLQVSITPGFTIGASGWKGRYDPGQTAGGASTFFGSANTVNSYDYMVAHYASIAQQLQIPMLWVGSEMLGTERFTSEWEDLISSVRAIYGGQLLYNVLSGELNVAQFYGALDAMSISAYYPLSDQADPSLSDLEAGWNSYSGLEGQGHWVAAIAQQEQIWQRPVYFGEVGYLSSTYAAQAPCCDQYHSSDPQLQYRCYQALDDTFRGYPWWGGVLWWSWDGGDYNMDGLPAEAMIGAGSVAFPPPAASSGGSAPTVSRGTEHQSSGYAPPSSAAGSHSASSFPSASASAGAAPAPTTQGATSPDTEVPMAIGGGSVPRLVKGRNAGRGDARLMVAGVSLLLLLLAAGVILARRTVLSGNRSAKAGQVPRRGFRTG